MKIIAQGEANNFDKKFYYYLKKVTFNQIIRIIIYKTSLRINKKRILAIEFSIGIQSHFQMNNSFQTN